MIETIMYRKIMQKLGTDYGLNLKIPLSPGVSEFFRVRKLHEKKQGVVLFFEFQSRLNYTSITSVKEILILIFRDISNQKEFIKNFFVDESNIKIFVFRDDIIDTIKTVSEVKKIKWT